MWHWTGHKVRSFSCAYVNWHGEWIKGALGLLCNPLVFCERRKRSKKERLLSH